MLNEMLKFYIGVTIGYIGVTIGYFNLKSSKKNCKNCKNDSFLDQRHLLMDYIKENPSEEATILVLNNFFLPNWDIPNFLFLA